MRSLNILKSHPKFHAKNDQNNNFEKTAINKNRTSHQNRIPSLIGTPEGEHILSNLIVISIVISDEMNLLKDKEKNSKCRMKKLKRFFENLDAIFEDSTEKKPNV